MSTQTPPAPNATQVVLDQIKGLQTEIADLKAKAATPVYPNGFNPNHLFHATSGPVGKDSTPYSVLKMIAVAQKWISHENAKHEVAIHNKLHAWLKGMGFQPTHPAGSLLVPFSLANLPPAETSEQESLVSELSGSIKGHQGQYDPNEANALFRKGFFRGVQKAFGTTSDAAGGVLVGFPTLGELIDLQRNMEVFPSAGATEVSLPPNGRIQFPKLAGGSTAYWVGEASSITDSTPSTGYLDLQAKKLGVLVKLNNELLRFTSPTTEALVRADMALQAALKMDLAQLEGTGGTQIKGLITYESAASWSQGTDKLLAYTVTSNKFQPNDPADMEALLPDMAGEPTAWLMRRGLWAKIRNRRADAVSAADAKGPFVFNLTRSYSEKMPLELEGTPVVRSSQISNTRGSGAQTYTILGNFRDWLIGRFGVMEFLTSGLGDTPFQNDQTWLRGIQHVDAGARHPASFVFADAIDIA